MALAISLTFLIFLYLRQVKNLRLFFTIAMTCAFIGGYVVAEFRSIAISSPVIPSGANSWLVNGQLSKIDRETGKRARYLVKVTEIDGLSTDQLPKYVRVGAPLSDAKIGSLIEFRAKIEPPSQANIPGGFSFASSAWFQQIGGTGFTFGHVKVLQQPKSVNAKLFINEIRYELAKSIRKKLPGQTGAIAAALVTGDRSAISIETATYFREAGVGHLLAISGLHMSLVGGMAFWIASLIFAAIPAIGSRFDARKPAAIIGLVAALAYLLISGGAAPAQRAFIMLSMIFIAVLLGRRALSIRTISIAAFFVALLTPEYVISPGFQMSFAASLALISFYQFAGPWLYRRKNANMPNSLVLRLARNFGYFLLAITMTSLVAGFATAPFASWHFNKIAIYSLLGNLLAMPLFTMVVMPSLFLGILLMPFGLDTTVFKITSLGLEVILGFSDFVANLPGAVWGVSASSPVILLLQAVALILICIATRRIKLLAIPLIAISLFLHSQTPKPIFWIGAAGGAIINPAKSNQQIIVFAKPNKYGLRQFTESVGMQKSEVIKIEHFEPVVCDPKGCAIELYGKVVVIQNTTEEIADACNLVDIVIVPGYLMSRQQPFCSQTEVFNYFSNKGTVFYIEDGRWRSVQLKNDRIWDRARTRYPRYQR
ncbi:MAG: ComEC/Rec2 family competence protein [Robiginitomaculum sp.]|nr:ComEC/Rec2 family competence protein [Robiginitomaculum sp.]